MRDKLLPLTSCLDKLHFLPNPGNLAESRDSSLSRSTALGLVSPEGYCKEYRLSGGILNT